MSTVVTYIYKPAWVANTFLVKAKDDSINDIDPLKIQKLVYNLHGWHLATTGMPVVGERFEAWPNGPVLSSLYHRFKHFRWRPITEFAKDVDPVTGEEKAITVPASDEQFHTIFEHVWDRYKSFSGVDLSQFTHAKGTPWSTAREAGWQYIPDHLIKAHFIELSATMHLTNAQRRLHLSSDRSRSWQSATAFQHLVSRMRPPQGRTSKRPAGPMVRFARIAA